MDKINIHFSENSRFFNIQINALKDAKNLKALVSVQVYHDENGKQGNFIMSYSKIKLIEDKTGKIFIVEPSDNYKDKDGNYQSSPYYLMNRTLKDALLPKIENEWKKQLGKVTTKKTTYE